MNPPKVVFPDSVGFRCRNCGVCCRMQPPDVDRAEQKAIENRGQKNFLAAPEETGIRWIKRKSDDTCHFLTKDNKCAIYPVRPAVCKLEPFTIADYDYDNNRIVLELNFPFSICCVGTNVKEIVNRKDVAESAQILMQKILALTAEDLELPITDKRVKSETRSRLLRRTVEAADLQF